MAYSLIVSQEAHRDVDDIITYIAEKLKNAQAAVSFLDDVENSYRRIVDNPHMYALCDDIRLHEKGYRKVVIKHYLVLYRVNEVEKTAYVARVIYGARDYTKLL